MAKSTRSKVKRAFRAKKRTEGVYAATEAARLQRLNAKLVALRARSPSTEEVSEDEAEKANEDPVLNSRIRTTEDMDIDGASLPTPKKISTHGPRNSGREQWRISKGMAPRAKARGMNRQGLVSGKHKPGRAKRRR
ncbi:hypothetical protein K488DRAFT_42946 [Vararia minispora EC-137]|uniref:Uncharacterized protein n=1 Tax=Vararia minispora EC-137 TaxID=1314806 RepID=A0ACB8QVD0_9AGAM|nr:hypothetical protein K488DRAFT_42946 [Vararia minispora EC-137]